MALIIALNSALSFAVTVMVVAPLVWSILTQDRDVPTLAAQRQRPPRMQTTRPALT